MATPHNEAKVQDIAKSVILVGDPLRAKHIAESFLEDAKLVNNIRNIQGWTGTYNGKKVTVMGHGMGMPSASIYIHELYEFYGVDTIVRVGSAGTICDELNLLDIVVAKSAQTDSNIAKVLFGDKSKYAQCSQELLKKCKKLAKKADFDVKFSKILTCDGFYVSKDYYQKYINTGCTAVEMETYALYLQAKHHNKRAISILVISDVVGKLSTHQDAEKRQKQTDASIQLALNILTK